MDNKLKIYVADLAAYVNGKHHGVWLDASDDVDDMYQHVYAMLANSPEENAEEFQIHGYDGPSELLIDTYTSIEAAHEIANILEQHGDIGYAALKFADCDLDDANDLLQNYVGCYRSVADYARERTEECEQLP